MMQVLLKQSGKKIATYFIELDMCTLDYTKIYVLDEEDVIHLAR